MADIDQKLPYHAKDIEECIEKLRSDKKGLSKKEAKERLQSFGTNELPEKGKTNPLILFLRQFKDLLVVILLIAAIIAFIADHMVDVYVIIGVIIINALISFFQEYKAEKAILSLKSLVKEKAMVLRDGGKVTIPSKNIVPGDIIVLEAGNSIPADARIIEQKNLQTTESSLTGESMPVDKNTATLDEETNLADRKNMLYKGTHIARGSCKAIVTATATNTELGKIAESLGESDKGKSNFKMKTDRLAKIMAGIAISTAAIVFALGYFVRDFEIEEILLVTIATLVSSIPEGLPAVLSIVLAIGAGRMAKKNAIIRDFSATEMAGSLSVILTDKTGTLTRGILTVKKVYTPDEKEYDVEGNGHELEGNILFNGEKTELENNQTLLKIAAIAGYSNSANIELPADNDDKDEPEMSGDPTELALLIFSEKLKLKGNADEKGIKLIDDIPFNSKQKFRASLIQYDSENEKEIICFGAPEKIISLSTQTYKDENIVNFDETDKEKITGQMDAYGKQAMRVIACAFKKTGNDKTEVNPEEVEEMVFAGLFAIVDPIRDEVKEAVEKSKKAGIRVVMVTGDHKNTAQAIAAQAGIAGEEPENKDYPQVLSEDELNVDDEKFAEYVENVNVFARVSPHTKLKILKHLQNLDHMAGMTGDGVNDAPALKAADVGFAMGQRGTDVAKDAAEVVLSDDNFASIINAIQQGRIVFRNIRQTSFFLITTNFASTTTLIAAIAMGMPVPLVATQILWVNLVTDGIMDISLATEPGSDDMMNQKPIAKKEPILNNQIFPYLFIIVPVMVTLALLAFNHYLDEGVEKARTSAFLVIAMTQVFNALNMRSLKKSAFKIGFFKNKWLNLAFVASFILQYAAIKVPFMQEIFHFENLPWIDILVITALSSTVFVFGELYKYIVHHKLMNKKDKNGK
jgi:Ca2+-transporting ATPase